MEVTTNTIYSLLKTAKTSGGKYTHVSMGSTKGQYYLSTANNDKFFRMYGKCLLKKTPLCLAEKQDEYVPLLGDIDIKIEVETEDALKSKGTRVLYSTEELLATIKCFQSAIKEVVIQPSESALTCVVLEKKPYLSNGFLKNGFHLHFPYLFLESSKVKNVLVPVIKKKIGECKLDNGKKLFEKHTETPENLVDDITNKCCLCTEVPNPRPPNPTKSQKFTTILWTR
ncbi:D5 family helicase-primase [Chloriridovirus anopheles1]|uniref:D5 family helicase-primase n=1 Tax=Chloriridovirus anopheles1 TaxID=1465751 RepID=W8R9J9_9VIRU|nr:D5 family helicase-primase [Anopheles minimus iridovirus]AHL67521.1 D5 family helicase-primase [Anopheles minimus iridovirus]